MALHPLGGPLGPFPATTVAAVDLGRNRHVGFCSEAFRRSGVGWVKRSELLCEGGRSLFSKDAQEVKDQEGRGENLASEVPPRPTPPAAWPRAARFPLSAMLPWQGCVRGLRELLDKQHFPSALESCCGSSGSRGGAGGYPDAVLWFPGVENPVNALPPPPPAPSKGYNSNASARA